MTDEQMRVKIAKACGWTYNPDLCVGAVPHLPETKQYGCAYHTPNYPQDLNACHEMEKVLTQKQIQDYFYNLNDVVGLVPTTSPAWIKEWAVFALCHATPRQRCEAFLRTLGLCEES